MPDGNVLEFVVCATKAGMREVMRRTQDGCCLEGEKIEFPPGLQERRREAG